MELHERAAAALAWFESGERQSDDTGRTIRTVADHNDEHGAWVRELCHEAHGDMMPDDFRYEMIEAALEYLEDENNDPDDPHEFIDGQVPVYNAERLRWLASHLERAGYCDEACKELGRPEGGILDEIAVGFYAEQEEVYQLVRKALDDADEDTIWKREKAAAEPA